MLSSNTVGGGSNNHYQQQQHVSSSSSSDHDSSHSGSTVKRKTNTVKHVTHNSLSLDTNHGSSPPNIYKDQRTYHPRRRTTQQQKRQRQRQRKQRQQLRQPYSLAFTVFCISIAITMLLVFVWVIRHEWEAREIRQRWQRLRRAKWLRRIKDSPVVNDQQPTTTTSGDHHFENPLEGTVGDDKADGGSSAFGNFHMFSPFSKKTRRHNRMRGGGDDNDSAGHRPLNISFVNHMKDELRELEHHTLSNSHMGIRWADPSLLKELPGEPVNHNLEAARGGKRRQEKVLGMLQSESNMDTDGGFLRVKRIDGNPQGKMKLPMVWQDEWTQMLDKEKAVGNEDASAFQPKVDYRTIDYQYPPLLDAPPSVTKASTTVYDKQDNGETEVYPKLERLGDIMKRYPQDDLDNPPQPFVERLLHFNYSNPEERAMAVRFRDANLPFKVYDVPEIPTKKWTDEYISEQFSPDSSTEGGRDDGSIFSGGGLLSHLTGGGRGGASSGLPPAGNAQESPNNFFAFFTPQMWFLDTLGLPPTRNNDWDFATWAAHARYADAVGLDADQPHFYWQAGVPKQERHQPKRMWSFISRDLPSFSTPNKETFFQWEPDAQKGIQCRFGERGVTAATHYDGGKNMVAMITGAKRYILSPPKECSKLGIVTSRGNSIFRHSLLNFGHISHLEDANATSGMSEKERAWLERASDSYAVETILKEGEVLHIPSHWFHYITSVQKSAQCNVRSGIDREGTEQFGNLHDVEQCTDQTNIQ